MNRRITQAGDFLLRLVERIGEKFQFVLDGDLFLYDEFRIGDQVRCHRLSTDKVLAQSRDGVVDFLRPGVILYTAGGDGTAA